MNMYLHDFIVSEKKFYKVVFLAENQLLRERFKVTPKEIGKEKIIFEIFFNNLDFFIYTRFGIMIGIENHLRGPFYTIPITIKPYSTI